MHDCIPQHQKYRSLDTIIIIMIKIRTIFARLILQKPPRKEIKKSIQNNPSQQSKNQQTILQPQSPIIFFMHSNQFILLSILRHIEYEHIDTKYEYTLSNNNPITNKNL